MDENYSVLMVVEFLVFKLWWFGVGVAGAVMCEMTLRQTKK